MPSGIRPTQNKVRKALFDILGDISGLSFLDLFAGSGAVGFEALSRGAKEAVLVEDNRACISAVKKNIQSLDFAACSLYQFDAQKAILAMHKQARKFDIIFMDPPYYKGKVLRLRSGLAELTDSASLAKKTLQTIGAYDILAPNGFVVIQHFNKEKLPVTQGDLILFKQSNYGDTTLTFYRKCAK